MQLQRISMKCSRKSKSKFIHIHITIHTFDGQYLSIIVQICIEEQTLHERRLAQSALSDNHQREIETTLERLAMYLLGEAGETNGIVIVLIKEQRTI